MDARGKRAIKTYGHEKCRTIYVYYRDNGLASLQSIAARFFGTVPQVRAAIHAGKQLEAIT